TVPSRPSAYEAPNREREFFRATRELMLGAGLWEVDTISLITTPENAKFPGLSRDEPVRVVNPLSEELRQLRLSLLPGMIAALHFNLNRQAQEFHAFEIAKVDGMRSGAAVVPYRLAALAYGAYARGEIGRPPV